MSLHRKHLYTVFLLYLKVCHGLVKIPSQPGVSMEISIRKSLNQMT